MRLTGDMGTALKDLEEGRLPKTLGLVGGWEGEEFQPIGIPFKGYTTIFAFDNAEIGRAYIQKHGLEGTCEDVETAVIIEATIRLNTGLQWMQGENP